jgi:hypothetical protein
VADDEAEHLAIASIRLRRLAYSVAPDAIPSFAEVGLAPLVAEAAAWQHLRVGSAFWEVIATADGTANQQDRWHEVGLLMGSAAESVLLATSAEIEIEILRRAVAGGSLPYQYVLAQRFFAESQSNQVLAFGHRLANLLVRALMLDSTYPFGVDCPNKLRRPFPVYSDNPAAWISLSELHSLEQLFEAAPHESLRSLYVTVIELRNQPEWRALEERRAVDFHRWRDETPLVAGAERATLWRHDPIGRTRTLELRASTTPGPATAVSAVNEIVSVSRHALDLLESPMHRWRQTWMDAMSHLSGGEFSWLEENDSATPTVTP